MSFAAEPYGLFVDDLLGNLTGGVSRLRFTFVDEELPFRIGTHERVQPESLRVTGLADGAFTQFVPRRDFTYHDDATLTFNESAPGVASAGALWPDPGTDVWVGFDRLPGGPAPVLNDRNVGSVTRTLAEAFAREYAVVSHQLDLVYQGAFVETATGRDLDSIAALVGVARRGATHARGAIVFRHATPAEADIDVVAGTLVSTGASAPVAVTVETTETVTLRRGTISVSAPVRAVAPGPAGVAAARTLTVVHRPILGIDDVLNPEPMAFGGGSEPDAELRQRITSALSTSGRSTVAALKGCLGALEGIREQDVLVEEDHLAYPGAVRVTVAADIDDPTAIAASRALEEHRPAGIRLVHNLPAPSTGSPSLPEDTGGGGDGPVEGINLDGVFVSLEATVTVTPGDLQLTTDLRDRLGADVSTALATAINDVGVGSPVIYNRLVAAVMNVGGVLDAVVEIGPKGGTLKRFNIRPPAAATRPSIEPTDLHVVIRGDRVVVDLTVVVERRGLAASAEAASALSAVKTDVEHRLVQALLITPAVLDPATIIGLLPATNDYSVERVDYRVELLDEGLRVNGNNIAVTLDPGQVVSIRSLAITEETVS